MWWCRLVCQLHTGEMLGESRLMMDESELRRASAPVRTATIVAAGHLVLLSISTAEARACFKGEYLNSVRDLGHTRRQMLKQQNDAGSQGPGSGPQLSSGKTSDAKASFIPSRVSQKPVHTEELWYLIWALIACQTPHLIEVGIKGHRLHENAPADLQRDAACAGRRSRASTDASWAPPA